MNKKKILTIIAIIIIIILSIVLIVKKEDEKKDEEPINKDYIFINSQKLNQDFEINTNNDGYSTLGIATNQEEYEKILTQYNINIENESKKDYSKNNYALIVIRYIECNEEIEPKNITTSKDKVTLKFNVIGLCGLCSPSYNLYEAEIPKNITSKDNVNIEYEYKKSDCDINVEYKPVLYLYPKKTTTIKVNFEHEERLTTTYPKYKEEWQVIANPNGDLYDSNNNYYYALYWEEVSKRNIDFSEGFYVTKDNAISFLEEKLTILGLNPKERNEFIMYWLPVLENNQQSIVYFELTKELQNNNKLIISPEPDTLIRIRINIKKVSEKPIIKEQQLTKQERNGFTAIEWGGVIHN
ncbi:MAG: hypothetical protein ACI4XM_02335 [Candidatus Coprovivens sp.]